MKASTEPAATPAPQEHNQAMNKPSAYKAMELWLRESGSLTPYILQQQEKAADDNAPLDALYISWRSECGWMRVAQLAAEHPFHAALAKEGILT